MCRSNTWISYGAVNVAVGRLLDDRNYSVDKSQREVFQGNRLFEIENRDFEIIKQPTANMSFNFW